MTSPIQADELMIRSVAMPADSNADGDVFGGWILSQMDLAGAVPARRLAGMRVVTVAVDNMVFHKPVFVGDCLECYARIVKTGRTSITVMVETYVERRDPSQHNTKEKEKITEGHFIYVAIGADRKPVPLAKNPKA